MKQFLFTMVLGFILMLTSPESLNTSNVSDNGIHVQSDARLGDASVSKSLDAPSVPDECVLARDRIQIYSQFDADTYKVDDDDYLCTSGCGWFTYAHAIQWLGLENRDSETSEALPIRFYLNSDKAKTNTGSSVPWKKLKEWYPGLEKKTLTNRRETLKEELQNGHVVSISYWRTHIALAVGYASDANGEYVHIVDSCMAVPYQNKKIPIYRYDNEQQLFVIMPTDKNFESLHDYYSPLSEGINWYNIEYHMRQQTSALFRQGGGEYWIPYSLAAELATVVYYTEDSQSDNHPDEENSSATDVTAVSGHQTSSNEPNLYSNEELKKTINAFCKDELIGDPIVGDFDGDGRDEMIIQSGYSSGNMWHQYFVHTDGEHTYIFGNHENSYIYTDSVEVLLIPRSNGGSFFALNNGERPAALQGYLPYCAIYEIMPENAVKAYESDLCILSDPQTDSIRADYTILGQGALSAASSTLCFSQGSISGLMLYNFESGEYYLSPEAHQYK